ncbi:MAG: efflux RND transporter periplasmic adaptor subunit [Caldilineaceae bacterium]
MLAQAQANLRTVMDGAAEAQRIEARANLQNAEAELRRAQRAYNEVSWRNDVGATPQSAALETATNMFEAAQAHLADLENGATPAQIAQASAQVRQADEQLNALRSSRPAELAAAAAEVRSAQAQLDKLRAGTRPEQLAQAEADVAAATARLQQQLVALGKLQLRAPFAGTVATVDVEVGEQVNPGMPVVRLADFSRLQMETEDLTELQVVDVREGGSAAITFGALPDVTVRGTVTSIRPYGETSAGDIVYRVVLTLPEQDARLRWNMTAAVTFDDPAQSVNRRPAPVSQRPGLSHRDSRPVPTDRTTDV